jgi:hypothetical protein
MFNEKQLKDIRNILRSEVEKMLLVHTKLLRDILEKVEHISHEVEEIEETVDKDLKVDKRILTLLLTSDNDIEGFAPIEQTGDTTMVPLAAGSTATFSTTPIPSTSVPDPSKIVWSSSDPVNAPVSANAADATGLSVNVTFPSTTPAGLVFSLTVSYTNADGTTATETDSFTTVAPAPSDITGFTPIVQSA